MWGSSFLVHLQAFRLMAGNFTIKWTPSQVFLDSILSSLHAPLLFWLKPPSIRGGGSTAPPCSQHLWKTLNFVLTLEAGGRKMPQNFLQSTWKMNMKKKTTFELYTNQNILAILRTFVNLQKKNMKLYNKWTSTAATTEAVSKIPNIKKISNEHFNLCDAEISIETFQMN